MLRQGFPYVATWFSSCRQLLGRNIVFSCHNTAFFLYRDRGFPCHERDGHDKRSSDAAGLALGRDFILQQSVFMSRHSLVKARSFYVATETAMTEHFRSRQSLVKAESFYVVIEYFYVTIKFDLGWGFYVATGYSYVATEFGLDMGF